MEDIFWNLLYKALWNTPVDLSLFTPGWDCAAVLKLARKQTVYGLIGQEIRNLPPSCLPDAAMLEELENGLFWITQKHPRYAAVTHTLTACLEEAGITPVLLKGQTLAREYPCPEYRSLGDIDIYVGRDRIGDAVRAVAPLLSRREAARVKDTDKHYAFSYKGVDVELHKRLDAPFNIHYYTALRWEESVLKESGLMRVSLGAASVWVPRPQAYVILQFLHICYHLSTGLGLRQLIDWALYLRNHSEEIDPALLKADLKRIGMLRLWKVLGQYVVQYLRLPVWAFPLYEEGWTRQAALLHETVMADGNFGKTNAVAAAYSGKNRLLLDYQIVKRGLRLLPLSPLTIGQMLIRYQWVGMKKLLRL